MNLDEWDEKIGHHLHMIEIGAAMCEQHVNCLIFRPRFETNAEHDLAAVEHTLMVALSRTRNALKKYGSLAVGN